MQSAFFYTFLSSPSKSLTPVAPKLDLEPPQSADIQTSLTSVVLRSVVASKLEVKGLVESPTENPVGTLKNA